MSTGAGPEKVDGDGRSTVGSVGTALLVWQRYGIHAFLVGLLAVPTYVVFDRGRLEAQIRTLEAEKVELRTDYQRVLEERNDWLDRYHGFKEEIVIQNRSNLFLCGEASVVRGGEGMATGARSSGPVAR